MQVASLHIYPLKSARRIDLDCAEVEARGFQYDRRWMLVDEAGELISQRKVPALALVEVVRYIDDLELRCDGLGSFAIERPGVGASCQVVIWEQRIEAHVAAKEANDWLSVIAGRAVRLVYQLNEDLRSIDPRFAKPGDRVSFADSYPLLLTSESSLRDLQGRLAQPTAMTRFRPNLVIADSEAFSEDHWRRIRVGEVSFRIVTGCDRCVVTTTDQESAARGVEPLRTLAGYRRFGDSVYFGVYAIPDGPGVIRRGDPIVVLESGASFVDMPE